MKGIELARRFYFEVGRPRLEVALGCECFWAAGLVGEGSECFGFDDEISRDHDWGPGFCVWLTDEQYAQFGSQMEAVYNQLPDSFMGFQRQNTVLAGKRTGIFRISDFYQRFLGKQYLPVTNEAWLALPESYLAVAVNGVVFEDTKGHFSDIRKALLAFYPEDVRRKKIAARLAVMAREGQYNYERCSKRGDIVASQIALVQFAEAAISVIYLLKKQYMPYYKWAWQGLSGLSGCQDYQRRLAQLITHPDCQQIEDIVQMIIKELRKQAISDSEDSFLQGQAMSVLLSIKDENLKKRHILEG